MTTKELIIKTNDINDLLSLYANCKGIKYWHSRLLIERKISSIEIPKIKKQLVSKRKFEKRITSPYIDLEKNRFSSKTREKKKAKKLYYALSKNKSVSIIAKLIKHMDLQSKEYFEYVSGADLSVFKKIQKLK